MRLKLLFIALCGFAITLHAQSTLAISSGASLTVSASADICADSIIGTIQGDGTRCGGLNSIESGPNDPLPKEFALGQNYPNPFNPVTTIRYQLPQSSHVTLKIYNIFGQVVATLVDGAEHAGFKSVEWNAGNIPSGVYLYHLQAGNFVETKKMILLR